MYPKITENMKFVRNLSENMNVGLSQKKYEKIRILGKFIKKYEKIWILGQIYQKKLWEKL